MANTQLDFEKRVSLQNLIRLHKFKWLERKLLLMTDNYDPEEIIIKLLEEMKSLENQLGVYTNE